MGTESRALPWVSPSTKAETPDQGQPAHLSRSGTEESQLSIYLAGKRTLDARNRKTERQNKLLWGAVFVVGTGLVLSVATNLRYSGQSQYIPYVLQTDRTGRVLNAQVLKPSAAQETWAFQTLIDREMRSWVEDWQTVTTDLDAQRTLADHVYARLDEHGDAGAQITEWYRAHDPIERAKTMHVEAEVQSLVPQSQNVYEAYWKEIETNLADRSTKVSHWRSVITIQINFSKKDPARSENADGLYIERLTTPQKDSSHD